MASAAAGCSIGGTSAGTIGDQPNSRRETAQVVRYVSPIEQGAAIAPCVEDAGYTIEVSPDGSYKVGEGLGPEFYEAISSAVEACRARFPIDPSYLEPLSQEAIERAYALLRDDIHPCLAEEGVQPPILPSLERYAETIATPETFVPTAVIQELEDDRYLEIFEKCGFDRLYEVGS